MANLKDVNLMSRPVNTTESPPKGIQTCEYHTEIRGWRGGGEGRGRGKKEKERKEKKKGHAKTKNCKNSRAGDITNALNFDHIS